MSATDYAFEQPRGLTLLDADDVDPGASAANTWREWAPDNVTGQRMCFDWPVRDAEHSERDAGPGLGWEPDTDDARYVAARKGAILRRRERAAPEAS